jgi:hypothetical protein
MREIRIALRRDGFKTPLPSKMRLCDANGRQLTEDVVRDKGLESYEDEILQLREKRRDCDRFVMQDSFAHGTARREVSRFDSGS